MNILLAVDGSKYSEAATRAILEEMRPDDATVFVLHVVEPPLLLPYPSVGRKGDLETFSQARLKEGRQIVAQEEELFRRKGFKVRTAVEEGDPRTLIPDFANQWGVNLIVVGSHGRKGLGRFLLGSVAESVARHASCSVLIVRIPSAT